MDSTIDQKTYGIFSNPANRKLIENLESNGGKVHQFPMPELQKINETQNSQFIGEHFSNYDLIVFTDVLAVECFLELIENGGIDLYDFDEKRVIAFGEAVSDRLRFSQIHSDIIPNKLEEAEIYKAILEYFQSEGIENNKFLIVKDDGINLGLTNNLKLKGAEVGELEIYTLKFAENKEIVKLKVLLQNGALDCFVLSSAEEILYLENLVFPQNISELFKEFAVFAANYETRQCLDEKGIEAIIN